MEQTQEEKEAAFMKKLSENKEILELHKKLIKEKLENWDSEINATIEYFALAGQITGRLFLALTEYAELYHKEMVKKLSSNTMLADDLDKMEKRIAELEAENKYHFAREVIFILRSCDAITQKVYLHWIDKLNKDENAVLPKAEVIKSACEYKLSHDAFKSFHEANYCPFCGLLL
jgi:hypothetical protein